MAFVASLLIGGVEANKPDMAAFVNALHLYDAALAVDPFYEWVPSKANISDLPSRLASTWTPRDREVMRELRSRSGYEHRDMRWPGLRELRDVRLMAARARETAREIAERR